MNGTRLLLGLGLLGVGGLVFASSRSGSDTGSDSGSGSGGGAPSWTPGPGGLGRIYGTPDIDLPPAFYSVASAVVDPSCEWVVEGDRFLPEGDAMPGAITPIPTLEDALAGGSGSAWPYVAELVRMGATSQSAAAALAIQVAALTPAVFSSLGLSVPSPSCPSPAITSPWAVDVQRRIQVWRDRVEASTPSRASSPLSSRRVR